MKTALLVLCTARNQWVIPEDCYRAKIGFVDGEYTPVKFV